MSRNSSLRGKNIILYDEQGLGDGIQCIRWLPEFARHFKQQGGKSITLCVRNALKRLFEVSFKDVSFSPTQDDPKEAEKYDYSLPITYLPMICGLKSYKNLPRKLPYIKCVHDDYLLFRSLLTLETSDKIYDTKKHDFKRKPRVGLVWSRLSRPYLNEYYLDQRRSIPFRTFMKHIVPADVEFVSLQHGARSVDLRDWEGQRIIDLMGVSSDFADTAALISHLDLVICVDTSVAHLAGALGHCPVWLIERWGRCWRWGAEEPTTPWYSNMRTFRRFERDPDVVMQKVGEAFQEWLQEHEGQFLDKL